MSAPAVAGMEPAVRAWTTGVPWRASVLPLAVLLAAADQFWVVALRTVAGAVERTSDPAVSWLRETLMLLPAYAVGIVVALGLAHRVFGGRTGGAGPVAGTIALVAGAAAVTGAAVVIASSLYDHRLQAAALARHSELGHGCRGACFEARLQESWDLQLTAVAAGVVLMLVTNLALVVWAVALRGRPIQLTARRASGRSRGRVDDQRTLLAGLLVAAAVVHAAVVPEHLQEWRAAGIFFLLVSGGQLAAAFLVHRRPTTPLLGAVVVTSCGLLLLWVWSRTTGLPFGPEPAVAESVGLADLSATALGLAVIATCVVRLRVGPLAAALPRRGPHVRGAVLAAVVAVVAVGVGGSGLPGLGLTVEPAGHEADDLARATAPGPARRPGADS